MVAMKKTGVWMVKGILFYICYYGTRYMEYLGVGMYEHLFYITPENRMLFAVSVVFGMVLFASILIFLYQKTTSVARWKIGWDSVLIWILVYGLFILVVHWTPYPILGTDWYVKIGRSWWWISVNPLTVGAVAAGLNKDLTMQLLELFTVVFMGPLLEELVYRGLLTSLFLEKFPRVLRYGISALLFTMIHQRAYLSGGFFAIYLVFALIDYALYDRRHNLLDSLGMHMLTNGLLYTVVIYLPSLV